MEKNGVIRLRLCILLGLYACYAAIGIIHCDAAKTIHRFQGRKYAKNSNFKLKTKIHTSTRFDTNMPMDSSNTAPYVSSPFSLPPYDSLPPISMPENTPPFCVYPPSTPQAPATIFPSPTSGSYTPSTPNGPPDSSGPTLPGPSPIIQPSPPSDVPVLPSPTQPILSPPYYEPSPPSVVPILPSPTQPILSPPYYEPSPLYYEPSPPYYEPSPPSYELSPPYSIPSPSIFVPSPTIFLPPIVYPPPTVPPPPHRGPTTSLWCVAKAAVPDPIIEEAMNYACGSGADCDQIQPNGPCFQPNTLFAHASYAFNSFWQRTKVAGGTCSFGGTALLVTVDPSYDGCHFVYY